MKKIINQAPIVRYRASVSEIFFPDSWNGSFSAESISKQSLSRNSGRTPEPILNKVYVLCGENDSEVARRLNISHPRWQYWRKGQHVPDAANLDRICRTFNLSVVVSGRVSEVAAEYGKTLDKQCAALLKEVTDLVEDVETDQDVIDHLRKQINFLRQVPRGSKKGA
jgi:transcriptional regulator with XRE-family HTH domain